MEIVPNKALSLSLSLSFFRASPLMSLPSLGVGDVGIGWCIDSDFWPLEGVLSPLA